MKLYIEIEVPPKYLIVHNQYLDVVIIGYKAKYQKKTEKKDRSILHKQKNDKRDLRK